MAFAVGNYSMYESEIFIFGGSLLFILAVLFTVIFLHYDAICCCCCDCCLGEELVVIHDPSNPGANLVWRNGQVSYT